MVQEIDQKQFWKLYKELPQELKDVLFAEETGDAIQEISQRHKVEGHSGEIVTLVGKVLLGLLMPAQLVETLKKEVGLKKAVAENVSREINRFIFYPVKPALEQLHRMEIEVTPKITTPAPPQEQTDQGEEPPRRSNDPYKESIE